METKEYPNLPYRDTKPQGAADFYLAINATFRFLLQRCGTDGWRQYLDDMADGYYRPVWERWRAEGLPAVAAYLRQSFAAEPGGETEVREEKGKVVLEVRECPAIRHLRAHGREIVPEFCQHCYFQGQGMAERAGMAMRLEGGAGCCRQTFHATPQAVPPQDFAAIRRVS